MGLRGGSGALWRTDSGCIARSRFWYRKWMEGGDLDEADSRACYLFRDMVWVLLFSVCGLEQYVGKDCRGLR